MFRSSVRSSVVRSRKSLAFIRARLQQGWPACGRNWTLKLSSHEHLGLKRKLGRSQTEGGPRLGLTDPGKLEQNAPGLDHGNPLLHCSFAASHPHFQRLFADRLVRKDTDPELTGPFYVSLDRHAPRLQLPRSDPAVGHGLKRVVAEVYVTAALR